ncbi:MAG: hypothetical protein VR64_05250 [Desulfatitalea sp. BRH_c12]|nr:MAG: hypothetical protein VR64_05250 [Desulfatitalea sp. BRH_c12]
MIQPIPFMAPRMVGVRFDEHAIPLGMLKDLAGLEEMIIEVAKWRYLKDHPNRKRSPKGFTDGISIKLTAIGNGSAVPQLSLFVEPLSLFPPENQEYFEKARDCVIGAINAAEHHGPIVEHLPESLLGYFDLIGRNLRDGESIEFDPDNIDRPARLTKATRRKLILASSQVQELTEPVKLRGSIPEADQDKLTFQLQLINGPKVIAPIATQHLQTVLDAFNGYKRGTRVTLQGIGRYNRNDRLQSIEAVEHLSLLDANDILDRLDEFREMKDGWLDGKHGFAPSSSGLDWLANAFKANYPDHFPVPYLYPTAEGGIQAEWSLSGSEITLEIDLDSYKGEWHALNMSTANEASDTLDLKEATAWHWIVDEINKLVGGAS